MYDGMVFATDGQFPTTRVGCGVYQISGNSLTAQITRMREGFPLSGFTGTIGTKDDDTKYIDGSLVTPDGTVGVEFEYRSGDAISQDPFSGAWSLDLKGALRGAQGALRRSDFGSVPTVLLVLTMLITGARRVRHVGYLQRDPLVQRVCGLSRIRHGVR